MSRRVAGGKVFWEVLLTAALVCASCVSAPKSSDAASTDGTDKVVELASDALSMPSEIFDLLQRPLGHVVSSQLRPIGRRAWEYHMAGIGWWDIYLMSGKKLGSGLYERTVETTRDGEIIVLHSTKSQFDATVVMVELLFVAHDRAVAENIRNAFHQEAVRFFGNQGNRSDDYTTWESGWFSYTSHDVQRHEDGKWIYLVNSFDHANSAY